MIISVITINYNNKLGLERTFNSVISQTSKDFEWIVVDGGSIDGSKEFLERNSSCFSFWCSEKDNGIYNAMNKGIVQATGSYCLFLNSGDEFAGKNVIENLNKRELYGDIIYGNCEFVAPSGEKHITIYPDKISLLFFYVYNLSHPATLIKKESLLESGCYDETLKISSDYKFWIESICKKRKFVHIPIIFSRFYMDGISSTNIELSNNEKREIIESYFDESTIEILEEAKIVIEEKLNMEIWMNRRLPKLLHLTMDKVQFIISKIAITLKKCKTPLFL